MAENKIHISRRLSASTLTLAWFAVFAVPVLLLQFSLDYLFKLTLQANQQAATATLIGEMSSFRHDLESEAFVERKLKVFFGGQNQPENSAKVLLQKLNSTSGLKVAGVVTYAADTMAVDFELDQDLQQQMPTLPRTMMQRYLSAVNNQHQHAFYSSFPTATGTGYLSADYDKTRKDADSFFRRQFGLIAEIPLQPDKVCRTVSAKLGGSAFFYYHALSSSASDKYRINGGHLLILRGCDLNQRQIWQETASMAGSGVKRSYTRLAIPLAGKNNLTREIITRFISDEAGFHLVSAPPDHTLVDLIQRGTFTLQHLNPVLKALPLLKVSVPAHDLHHPLAGWARSINMFARLFAMLGAVFLLRLFFYGIDFRLGIRGKILLGAWTMLLMPIVLLLAGFVTWSQFNRIYGWYQAEELQQQYFNELYDGFGSYLNLLQKQSLAVAAEVEKASKNDEAAIPEILQTGLASSCASDIYLDRSTRPGLHFKSQNYHLPGSQKEESARRLVYDTILNSFDRQGNFVETLSDGKSPGVTSVDAVLVNNLINSWAKPFNMLRINTNNRFSTAFVYNDDKYSPYALLSFKYSDITLMHEFISRHFKPSSRFSGISAKFFLAENSGTGYQLVDLADGQPLQNQSLLEKISIAENVENFVWRESGQKLMQMRWFNDYPLVVMAAGEVFAGDFSVYLVPAMLIGYGTLLILFIYLFFELIYLRPIREFIRVTAEVGAGNYAEQVRLQANDEFGDLQKVFTGMIQGLEQRRKLAHFVSQDVRAAVESGDDAMAPGGVRVAATVVFIQLQTVENFENCSADRKFALLSHFISTGDRIVDSFGGVIDKVVEDTLMLVFRETSSCDSHCLRACRAVLQIAADLKGAGMNVRAGIASGNVVLGRIGSRLGKLDYTVIGDTVNLAARLKALPVKAVVTGIIIAPSTIRILRGKARVGFLERTEIKGKSRKYPVYELLELRQG